MPGEKGGPQEPLKAALSSRRIGGPCLANWQVKLSIKEKLAWPGQGGDRKCLALVGSRVKKEREREREREPFTRCGFP